MTEPTIDTIITELREAYEAAAGGEWTAEPYWFFNEGREDFTLTISGKPRTEMHPKADAELIVKAHNYLPRLLDELEKLRKRLNRFEAVDPHGDNFGRCVGCGNYGEQGHKPGCSWAGVSE